MCTAVWNKADGLFGRTLDLEYTYAEQVVASSAAFWKGRYGMVGMATVADGYPLYYDAVNEKGVAMAGLHFPRSCVYPPPCHDKENVGSYALIPRLLSAVATVTEAVALLGRLHLCDRPFSADYPPTPLHWMLADRHRAVVVESTAAGLQIQDNPVGVLTNEPPLSHQLSHLSLFAHLTPQHPRHSWQTPLSRGVGTVGMPGDYSSPGRFVRAAFGVAHAPSEEDDKRISAYLRRMAAVEIPRGFVQAADGRWVESHYTACMDLRQGVYYYRTAACSRITGVPLHAAAGQDLRGFPLPQQEDVRREQ